MTIDDKIVFVITMINVLLFSFMSIDPKGNWKSRTHSHLVKSVKSACLLIALNSLVIALSQLS